MRWITALLVSWALLCGAATAQERLVYLADDGVVRWRANNEEVRLFGANYCAFSGQDYRAALRAGGDVKAMIDEDMAHFARMGWDGLRLCSWGDWENADAQGNLIANEHVDLMDYLVAQARARGIYILLTPIHTYNANWPDQMDQPNSMTGFSSVYDRGVLGTERAAIAAQVNYIRQLLNHVNPYTGVAYKDEPAILFIEMINEPVHHPENVEFAAAYIDSLVRAVRSTGSEQITFHNYTQDFRIGPAIDRSTVQGVTMGWYPSGLVAGRTLQGNFLQSVDNYAPMLSPDIAGMPRIVYEFDSADLATGYLYPAMARTYRSVGAQFAAMFAYDMLRTAPYNLGWQTHFMSLVHSPRKAASGIIAAEVMRRLPRMENYGRYPESRSFGDFRVSYEDDLAELNAADAFMHSADTTTRPRQPAALQRIVGLGSSPVVDYEGTGLYFLDKLREGVWRLEIYPDSISVAEPFAQPQPGRIVSRLYARPWPMRVTLPDLGGAFTATPLTGEAASRRARGATFDATPGVWLLRRNAVDPAGLPTEINRVGFREYHVNAPQTYPDLALSLTPREFVADAPVTIRVRVASPAAPENVTLHLRGVGGGQFRAIPMTRARGYDYIATLPRGDLAPGLYDYVVSSTRGGVTTTFPGSAAGRPGRWPFFAPETWRFTVAAPATPLVLFDPARDVAQLSFVRPHESFRGSAFRVAPGESSTQPAITLSVPQVEGAEHPLYAAALYVGESVASRGAHADEARTLAVRLRASGGARKTLELYLIEKDGSSWCGQFAATGEWQTLRVPLAQLAFSRSILIPSPFPQLWNYWREGPQARAGGRIRAEDVERLELRVSRVAGENADGVEIGSVWLEY